MTSSWVILIVSALTLSANGREKCFFYDRGNYAGLSEELFSFLPLFEELSVEGDINTVWNLFKEKILTLIDKFIPSKVLNSKQRKDKPWFNKKLRVLVKKKRCAYLKHKRRRDSNSLVALQALRQQYRARTKLSKRAFF